MGFTATFPSAASLITVFNTVKQFVSDAIVYHDDAGLKVSVMDSSHVCLIESYFTKEYLTEYQCSRSGIIGIHAASLLTMLKFAERDATVAFILDTKDNHIIIRAGENEFNLGLIDIEADALEVPEPKFEGVVVNAQKLSSDMKNLSLIGDTVDLTVEADCIVCKTSGDIGSASLKLPCENTNDSQIHGSFSLRYINSFMTAASLSNNLMLTMEEDRPMMFSICIGDCDDARLLCYLAPRMEDN